VSRLPLLIILAAAAVPGFGLDPDVLIDGRSVRAFDTDYQMDSTMWAAFSTYEDTAFVYKSTDHGTTWQRVLYVHWTPLAPIQDVGLVIGEGDSAFVFVFLHSPDNRGECWLLRTDLEGQNPYMREVFAGPDVVNEFAVCRDYSGDDYWVYAVVCGSHPDDWCYFLRTLNLGRTWQRTDSVQGWTNPHVSGSGGTHMYYAASRAGTTGEVLAKVNDHYGWPDRWTSWEVTRGSSDVGGIAIASDFLFASESSTVWLAWAEDTLRNGDWDIHYAWTMDEGSNWNIQGVLAGGPGAQSHPDLRNYTARGNEWMNLSYISDQEFREVHRRHCHRGDPSGWSTPTVINTTDAGTGSKVVPRLTYSPGAPGTGAGCVFAGAGLDGLYWNAPWYTAVAEEPSRAIEAQTATLVSRARLLEMMSGSASELFDATGRRVADPVRVAPGVYVRRTETSAGFQISRVVVFD